METRVLLGCPLFPVSPSEDDILVLVVMLLCEVPKLLQREIRVYYPLKPLTHRQPAEPLTLPPPCPCCEQYERLLNT